MSNLYDHARRELALIGGGDDEMQKLMNSQVLEVVALFASHGHSGFSASYALGLLKKLLAFEPLTPLTGADDEWAEVGEGMFQNKRCPHVFKDASRFDGQPYDIQSIIWRDPDGSCCTNWESAQVIVLPYTPVSRYVDRIPK